MAKAIRFYEKGGPDVLRFEDVALSDPGPTQALVRHTAIGVNYIDTYHRTGLYPLPLPLPGGLGREAAGVVEAVGAQVHHLKPGDRVAYESGTTSAYAEAALVAADRLIKLPDDITDRDAAAIMLKGLTVQYLVRRTYRVRAGETVLWHAAAGGVGLIACQWLRALGVTVIGTVGSDEKVALAKSHGCEHVIVYTREDFVARVKEITHGQKLPVVYDSVGKSTWLGSLDCLQPLGLMVTFGNASGPVKDVDLGILAQKGSLYVTRPTLATYAARREDLEAMCAELFEMIRSGKVKVEIGATYPLADAAQAHRDLEARKTTGSLLLVP